MESVSRKPLVLAQLLKNADEQLARKLQQDEKPLIDIDQLTQYSHRTVTRYYLQPHASDWGGPILYKDFMPMPSQIQRLLRGVHEGEASLTGLLPEIDHAYVTVGGNIYLWNYLSGDRYHPVAFNGLDKPITAVGVSPPKPGVFEPSVRYLLVLATRVEVILVAVSNDPVTNQITLRETDFSISTDNIEVAEKGIAGTAQGRIFLACKNGTLSEITYTNQESPWMWLGLQRNIQRLERSTAPYARFVPAFFRLLGYGDELLEIKVDDTRNILYTLSRKSNIEVYDLGISGNEKMACLGVRRTVFDLARDPADGYGGSSDDARFFRSDQLIPSGQDAGRAEHKIISVEVVPPHISKGVHLVAISNYGFRFYCTTSPRESQWSVSLGGNQNRGRPAGLRVKYVQKPPSKEVFRWMNGVDDKRSPSKLLSGKLSGVDIERTSDAFHQVTFQDFQSSVQGGVAPGKPVSQAIYGGRTMLFVHEDRPEVYGFCGDELLNRAEVDQSMYMGRQVNWIPKSQQAMDEVVCVASAPVQRKFTESLRQSFSARDVNYGRVVALKEVIPKRIGSSGRLAQLMRVSKTPRTGTREGEDALRNADLLARLKDRLNDLEFDVPSGLIDDTIPLKELAMQHINPRRAFVALQVDDMAHTGVTQLTQLRPIDVLHRKISEWDLTQEGMKSIESFFRSFGQEQACAMCFSLACGLPQDAGMTSSSHAHRNQLSPGALADIDGLSGRILRIIQSPVIVGAAEAALALENGAASDFAITRSEFNRSQHHEGLLLFLSRLLRPIWFRPLVVLPLRSQAADHVAENTKRLRTSNEPLQPSDPSSGSAPPLLLTQTDMNELKTALQRLSEFMEQRYHEDIQQGCDTTMMAEVRERLPLTFFEKLKQEQYKVFQHEAQQREAKRREGQSLLGIYCLVNGALQALTLVHQLGHFHSSQGVKVNWRLLNGKTLRDLVVSEPIRRSIREQLDNNRLIEFHRLSSNAADELTKVLENECGLFYTEAARLHSQAKAAITSARNYALHQNSQASDEESQRAIRALIDAARHWRSPTDVETMSGPLRQACAEMLRLHRPDGLTEICLKCACNFTEDTAAAPVGALSNQWVFDYITDTPDIDAAQKANARNACYGIVFETLRDLIAGLGVGPEGWEPPLEERGAMADEIIVIILTKCAREMDVHYMLYDLLMEISEDRLVKIESDLIVTYLEERKADDLLWKHHTYHGRYVQAIRHMELIAHVNEPYPLSRAVSEMEAATDGVVRLSRVECMERACASATESVNKTKRLGEKLDELSESLRRARRQENIRVKLESGGLGSRASDEELNRLRYTLVDVSDLYDKFAFAYGMWDECLEILKEEMHQDTEEIDLLWHAIFLRRVPLRSSIREVDSHLRCLAENWQLIGKSEFIQGFFESGDWIQGLSEEIQLLQHLYDGHIEFVFPVRKLCFELEELNGLLSQAIGWRWDDKIRAKEDWVVESMHSAGVSYDKLYEEYRVLLRVEAASKSPATRLQMLRSFTLLIERWMHKVDHSHSQLEVQLFRAPDNQFLDTITSAKVMLSKLNASMDLAANQVITVCQGRLHALKKKFEEKGIV